MVGGLLVERVTERAERATSLIVPDLAMVQPHWYVLYTCANHEKHVAAELSARTVEHFLPLYRCVRRWKDRRVTLDMPLFPGYVFVRLALRDRLRVVQIPSVVCLVGFGGWPVALPDTEMEIMRSGFSESWRAEPHAFLTVGRRVRITGGPFAGMEGVLERRKNNFRVVVSLELIQKSVAVDVDAANVASATIGVRNSKCVHPQI
jgi:transcription antitermination factor NusG